MRNNKNIWIDRKLVFYKTFFDKNVILILQFVLSKSNLESLKIIKNETDIMCYFLQWAGLRAAIPQMLKVLGRCHQKGRKDFYYNNTFFDVGMAKNKHYYSMFVEFFEKNKNRN